MTQTRARMHIAKFPALFAGSDDGDHQLIVREYIPD
jgi:hypothetical protein